MPRQLSISGSHLPEMKIYLQKFTREDLYGIREKLAISAKGKLLKKAHLSLELGIILPEGSLNSQHWGPQGNLLEDAEIIETDFEGHPLTITKSIFETGVNLEDHIPIEEFLRYDITGTYQIKSADSLNILWQICEDQFAKGFLYRIPYAYYDTTHPLDGLILPFENQLLLLVGRYSSPIWGSPTMNMEELYGDVEDEDEFHFEEVW